MSRKDYELIAAALSTALAEADGDREVAAVENTARIVASALASDNQRFDRTRFLAAAGVK